MRFVLCGSTQTGQARSTIFLISPPFLQVLNDGFSRFDKNQMTSAIDFYQQQFIRSDLAVRKGGVFGIRTGADDHNEEHNRIMYTAGTLLPPFTDA